MVSEVDLIQALLESGPIGAVLALVAGLVYRMYKQASEKLDKICESLGHIREDIQSVKCHGDDNGESLRDMTGQLKYIGREVHDLRESAETLRRELAAHRAATGNGSHKHQY